MGMQRSQFATKTGIIAATVGSAVGLGNIWRFPYEAGVHGGGAFLIIYIVCVFVVGLPVMLSEFTIGRSTHQNGVGAFRTLAPRSPFRYAAHMGILASLMIMSFYAVVAGWILEYLYQSIVDLFVNSGPEQYSQEFANFISNPWRTVMWTIILLAINFLVIIRGIEKGIERWSKMLMPILFVMLIAFCVNSLMMPKASEGLEFLFKPKFYELSSSVVIGAMGQAFFSLSVGVACMLTYASYFSESTNLTRSAAITCALDTVMALISGMIIFPAVFTYGMQPEAGPKLVFETFPAIFAQMPGGNWWAIAFYALLFFASLTSTISMGEISISYFIEEFKMGRTRATTLFTIIAMVGGILCALSFGVLSDFTIFGKTIFNLFDYVSSNILLPCGGIMMSLFMGWQLDKRILWDQLTNRGKLPGTLVPLLRFCMRFIAPISILIIFIYGLI